MGGWQGPHQPHPGERSGKAGDIRPISGAEASSGDDDTGHERAYHCACLEQGLPQGAHTDQVRAVQD